MIVSEDTLRLLLGLSSSITDEEQGFLTLIHPQAESAVKEYLKYDPEQKDHTEYYPRHQRSGGPGYGYDTGTWDVAGNSAYWSSDVGASTLQLTHIPIRSVTSVIVDPSARHGDKSAAFADSLAWTVSDDYWVDWDQEDVCATGELKAFGSWPDEPGTVKVVYRAGYSPLEFLGQATSSTVDGMTITTAGLSATGIALAVQATVIAAFTRAMSMRKKATVGWTAAPIISERLQDYSYTLDRTGQSASGLAIAIPDDAMQYLTPFMHYGIWRL